MRLCGIDPRSESYPNYRRANAGGPMSRTRREAISSTLLGNDERMVRCPRIVRLGIGFPDGDPVEQVMQVLSGQGFVAPQDLLDELDIPAQRLVTRAYTSDAGLVNLADGAPRDVLWHALMLGLCAAHLYDPHRPVLWTQTSLRRRLELFDPTGVGAD